MILTAATEAAGIYGATVLSASGAVLGLLWLGLVPAGLYPPSRGRHRAADPGLQAARIRVLREDTDENIIVGHGARTYSRLNRDRLLRAQRSVVRRARQLLNGATS